MVTPRPAAPFYVHPLEAPDAWARLRAGTGLAFAVVNVADGPGDDRDDAYRAALAPGCATPLVGYVDVAYGRRPVAAVLADAAAWRSQWGVRSVMLDQVPSAPRAGAWSLDVIDALRAQGAERVVTNPGTVPHPELLDAADATCVVEGGPRTHAAACFPAWLRAVDPARVWHLLHSCPAPLQPAALALAGRRGAGLAWATAGRLPNPWARLQERW